MTAYLASGVKFVGFLVDFPFVLASKWVTFLPCTGNKLTEHRGEINKWFWNSVNVKMPCVLLRKKMFLRALRAQVSDSPVPQIFCRVKGGDYFSKSNQNVRFLQKSRKHGLRLPLMMSA